MTWPPTSSGRRRRRGRRRAAEVAGQQRVRRPCPRWPRPRRTARHEPGLGALEPLGSDDAAGDLGVGLQAVVGVVAVEDVTARASGTVSSMWRLSRSWASRSVLTTCMMSVNSRCVAREVELRRRSARGAAALVAEHEARARAHQREQQPTISDRERAGVLRGRRRGARVGLRRARCYRAQEVDRGSCAPRLATVPPYAPVGAHVGDLLRGERSASRARSLGLAQRGVGRVAAAGARSAACGLGVAAAGPERLEELVLAGQQVAAQARSPGRAWRSAAVAPSVRRRRVRAVSLSGAGRYMATPSTRRGAAGRRGRRRDKEDVPQRWSATGDGYAPMSGERSRATVLASRLGRRARRALRGAPAAPRRPRPRARRRPRRRGRRRRLRRPRDDPPDRRRASAWPTPASTPPAAARRSPRGQRGRRRSSAARRCSTPRASATREIAAELGGLSAGKLHAADLAADALHRALGAAVRARAPRSRRSPGATLVAM